MVVHVITSTMMSKMDQSLRISLAAPPRFTTPTKTLEISMEVGVMEEETVVVAH